MLEGLATVAWHELDHNHGVALDTPVHLRALLSSDPEVVESAFTDLNATLYDQGGLVCGAATAALPFLVEVAQSDVDQGVRVGLVDLVGRLAIDGVIAEQVDSGWHAAWFAVMPELLDLLADPVPEVRRVTAWAVAQAPSVRIQRALRERWQRESDPTTRVALVQALELSQASEDSFRE